jgi:EPS-associated MarR family transcriptional regulator
MPTELQFRVLRLLESNPHLSQRELSKSLGVSLGGVNYCLNALVAKGSIKIQNFRNNQNKWVYAYLLTPQGLAEKTALTGAFLKRKMQEYQELKAEIESLSCEVANQTAIKEAEDEIEVLKDQSAVVIKFGNVSNAN